MKALNRKNIPTPKRPVKVLQFGEGNFLRGFVDWMIEEMNEKAGFDGNVKIVQPLAQGLGEMLNAQEGLYHVKLQGIQAGQSVDETKLITCVEGVNNPYAAYQEYLNLGTNPDLKFIISNTTEAGIAFDENDIEYRKTPVTFPGKLTALLLERYKVLGGDEASGLVIIPCELIDKNGEQLKAAILKYISLWGLSEEFKNWIENHNTFCNTLVDRIVPGFPKDNIKEIQEELGFEDNLVVMAEPFHLWVIEGPEELEKIFPGPKAGLQIKFVKDQSPYRTRKVRILNGAHTALVPVAYLAGLRTVRESVEDPKIGAFIHETIYDEIIPTLDLSQEELEQFASDVLDRFKNPFIRHELSAIALNSISKFRVRVLPSILEYHSRNGSWPKNLIQSFAALLLFYKGEFEGVKTPVNDDAEIIAFFEKLWSNQSESAIVEGVLKKESFWGEDLSKYKGLSKAISEAMRLAVKIA
ncbi:mannitol-1-phosphate/altronate dehydrogenase [Belliella baltica DSM 15883]|uniref:Mannitol-1-phosphate/altronate dehydrogenase n=1 Tax=Belliella baltica (strain DSM 15883 / CIP 108006 / LMG 21964 / BA134) TaxID=866536 RepID=I3Z723_BELBD|nr:tagaturonate reductase [Belliella baltica]AFL85041.1 mannitol-1-phosphate/altronate dehydrogenase [Belliella baltica DSM 15883]